LSDQSLDLPGDPVAKPTHHDLDCGCRVEMDPDGPIWLTAPCAEHTADRSDGLMRIMGLELDALVHEACSGRKLEPRHRPKDPYR
jgi:hypothetical protein